MGDYSGMISGCAVLPPPGQLLVSSAITTWNKPYPCCNVMRCSPQDGNLYQTLR